MGRAHDNEEKHHRHHDFRDEARDQGVLAGRMLAISIRRKTLGDIESGGAARNHIEQRRSDDRTDHLRDHIRRDLSCRKTAARGEADRNGRVEMAPGHMTDGIGHRHDAQPERQRHTDQTDTNLWKRCGDNRAAATGKCQPKRTDRFGGIFLRIHIAVPPAGS